MVRPPLPNPVWEWCHLTEVLHPVSHQFANSRRHRQRLHAVIRPSDQLLFDETETSISIRECSHTYRIRMSAETERATLSITFIIYAIGTITRERRQHMRKFFLKIALIYPLQMSLPGNEASCYCHRFHHHVVSRHCTHREGSNTHWITGNKLFALCKAVKGSLLNTQIVKASNYVQNRANIQDCAIRSERKLWKYLISFMGTTLTGTLRSQIFFFFS